MKKYILLLSMFLMTTIMFSQEFKKWAFDIEGGFHSVNDESAIDADQTHYLGAGFRYNFNPTFGLGARVGFNDLSLISLEGVDARTRITRFNTDATVNIFRVLDLYSSWFTVLVHGGPGVALINRDSYDETVLNNQIGITGLFKLNKSVALKLDYTVAANISQQRTLDGYYASNNYGVTSTVHSASIGAVFYIGNQKDKSSKEHADWYVYPTKYPEASVVNNTYPTTVIKETIKEEAVCNCNTEPQSEFVFFDHDKYNIKDTELNAIYKAFAQLQDNSTYRMIIKGFASPTNSSAAYNEKLSANRAQAIRTKFELMGADMSRISTEFYGKDLNKTDGYVHDAARRVELIIIKK